MVLTGPLLETKVHVPRPRASLVARPRLSERLNRGSESKLTLISAPAGFGKSTLLAEWLATPRDDGRLAAWLSLDQADNEPAAFWTYVISALRTVVPGIGEGSLSLLESPQTRIDRVLAPLLNELAAVPNDLVLVLDDFHLIDVPDIQEGMAYLLDHLPGRTHLVIATRADPPLPLARLRARGELVEIRAADLRFTPEEAAAYLNEVMALNLGPPEVAALEGRTEGWIAALQLAGLSMQGRNDVTGFITGFAGDDRYVVDYLVEEVLHRQSEDVRSFLLRTSILARMTGPLCDAVTGRDGGRATLEALDRANLFVVSLDDRREWYRYHHLFAGVLQVRLMDELPDQLPELHGRASEWYQQQGDRADAIHHAMAGGDLARAASLVELAVPEMHLTRQEARLRRWLEALPPELFHDRPVLSVAYAGALMSTGESEGVHALLDDAERTIGVPKMVVVNESELGRLPASIAMYRTALALLDGDMPGTIAHAERALGLVDEDDHVRRGGATALIGLAHWTDGDLEQAYRWFADGMSSLGKGGHTSDVVGGAITLADIRIDQGRLHEAMRLYEEGLNVATSGDGPPLRGAADMHVGICGILSERNDLAAAARHLQHSRDLGEENGLPKNAGRSRLAAARILRAEGNLDGTLERLDEAERLYVGDFSPNVRPIGAIRARVWIAQGRLSEAWGWAQARGVSAADDLSYVREFEHATLARLLLTQGALDRAHNRILEAIQLLDRLLSAAIVGGRMGSAIDLLVVHALAHHATGDPSTALASLERAIVLAEPEGYVRTFVDEGAPMTALLKLAAKQRIAPAYLPRLIAPTGTGEEGAAVQQPLIEPLSDRELEVLRLLESDLAGPDIARELFVSVNTLRTHTKNIYAKLGVNSRRAAVRRAAELRLLARTSPRPPTA